MSTGRAQLSTPFVDREFNGRVLLDELEELKVGSVPQRHLVDCALAARELGGLSAPEATARLKHLATSRFAGQRPLASLLVRWAPRLRTEADVAALAEHLERLALTSALALAARRATERLGGPR